MNKFIKNLIDINKQTNEFVSNLEDVVANVEIKDAKDKADFGNYVVALKGYRMVSEATEAILFNNGVVITDEGNYYEKVDSVVEKTSSPVEESNNEQNKQ